MFRINSFLSFKCNSVAILSISSLSSLSNPLSKIWPPLFNCSVSRVRFSRITFLLILARMISNLISDAASEAFLKFILVQLFFSKFSPAFAMLQSSLSIASISFAPSFSASIASMPVPVPKSRTDLPLKSNFFH